MFELEPPAPPAGHWWVVPGLGDGAGLALDCVLGATESFAAASAIGTSHTARMRTAKRRGGRSAI